MSISGRFDTLAYTRLENYLLGYMCFTLYMRWFLTPIALATWANLNHTLCGTYSDPVWDYGGLGKWYYPLAEIYLAIAASAFILINWAIAFVTKRIILFDVECSHGLDQDQSRRNGGDLYYTEKKKVKSH